MSDPTSEDPQAGPTHLRPTRYLGAPHPVPHSLLSSTIDTPNIQLSYTLPHAAAQTKLRNLEHPSSNPAVYYDIRMSPMHVDALPPEALAQISARERMIKARTRALDPAFGMWEDRRSQYNTSVLGYLAVFVAVVFLWLFMGSPF